MWFCLLLLIDISSVEGNAPNIDYSHNMRVLKLPRETPVGTLIYRLKGSDGDSDELTFGANNGVGQQLLEFRPVLFNSADVILRVPLTEEEYTVSIFVTDGVETTEVQSTIIVTNGTGLPHPFVDYTTLLRVPENTKINSSIGYVTARERENSNLPVTFELRGSDKFKIRYEFGPRGTSKAVIQLIGSLDYETKNLYELDVVALNAWTDERYDTRNIATLPVAVVAQDVPDTPPRFKDVPPVVTVSDSAQPGTSVLNLTAEDGDYGSPRNLSFKLDKESPWSNHFSVNPQTGEVKISRPIAELSDKYGGTAVYLLRVTARETTATLEYPAMEASTQFAVVLMSKENHPPVFGSELYTGFIAEHSAHLTAVSWAPGVMPKVYDRDQGRNSTFRLYLEDDGEVFSVHPNSGSREADFAILVRDSSRLDYEVATPKYIEFKLVAAETEAVVPLTTTVDVRVNIVDVNDHPPMFTRDTYEATLAEDAKPGAFIARVTATDPDSGLFGKVRYTSINGPIARNLKLDPETGEVTLVSLENLDRETASDHVLTVEAHDEDGRGQRTVTRLHVHIGDANDNAPVFGQKRYDAVLTADLADFTEPVVLKASDVDAPGPNSNVTYEIVNGNYEQKFRVDPVTGALSLSAPLTMSKNGLHPILLTVRAHDQGIPVRSSAVPVHVHTQEYLNRSIVVLLPGSEGEIKQRRDQVERGLSDMLGANVNIYSMQPFNHSNEATMVRAWAVYESQPIDLKSFTKIMSNIYGKEYAESRENVEKTEVKKSVISDRILWILIIVFILIIILLLLIMLCCCWRYFLRNKRPHSGRKVSPAEHSFHERYSGNTDVKAIANGRVPNGPSRRVREDSTQTGHAIKSIAVGTPATKDDISDPGTDESTRAHYSGIPSEDRQLLIQQMRQVEADGRARHIGNYLVVRRDARRRRPPDPGHQRPPSSDSLSGTSRGYELSGDGPRRTEILYIRSPPPEETDPDENSRYAERDAGAREGAYRREKARRVRFSRYHKVDDGSFTLPQSSDSAVAELPREQVWLVPQDRTSVRHKNSDVTSNVVHHDEAGRRRAHVGVRLQTVEDSRETTSEGEDELERNSKNRAANDPLRDQECEADGQQQQLEELGVGAKSSISRKGAVSARKLTGEDEAREPAEASCTEQEKQNESDSIIPGQPEPAAQDSTILTTVHTQTSYSPTKSSTQTMPAPQNAQPSISNVQQGTPQHHTTILTLPAHQIAYPSPLHSLTLVPTDTLPNSVLTPTKDTHGTAQSLATSLPSGVVHSYSTAVSQQPTSFFIISSPAHVPPLIVSQPYVISTHQTLPAFTVAQSPAPPASSTLTPSHATSQPLSSVAEGVHTCTSYSSGASSNLPNTHVPGPSDNNELRVAAPDNRPQDGAVSDNPVLQSGAPTHVTPQHRCVSNINESGAVTVTSVHPRGILRDPEERPFQEDTALVGRTTTGLPATTGGAGEATDAISTMDISGSQEVPGVQSSSSVLKIDNMNIEHSTPVREPPVITPSGPELHSLTVGAHPEVDRSSQRATPQKHVHSTLSPRNADQSVSAVYVSTTVTDSNVDVLHETLQTEVLDSSEFDVIERDFKTSIKQYVDTDHEDSDSGIGPATNCLRLKNNAFIEKKSVFTIAYDGVNTQKLRCSVESTPSP